MTQEVRMLGKRESERLKGVGDCGSGKVSSTRQIPTLQRAGRVAIGSGYEVGSG